MAKRRNTLGRMHLLGGGFAVMWDPGLEVDDPELEHVVILELAVEDGRLVVAEFTARRREDGPPVTIEFLKSVPLVSLTARAADAGLLRGLMRGHETAPGSWQWAPARLDHLEELPEVERAAVVYRLAFFFGLGPTSAVADVLGVSREVAAKRVQRARREGLLEPTTKGRKGT